MGIQVLIDFTSADLRAEFQKLDNHESSAFLMAATARALGLDVRFYRSQHEAQVSLPLFSREVKEAIFYSVSDGKQRHFFNGTQSDSLSRDAALATRDKLRTKALLHRRNLATPAGGAVSAQNRHLLDAMYRAGVRRFVLKPIAGSLGEGVFLHQTASQVAALLSSKPRQEFILEQQIVGTEHRLYVVGDRVVSAYRRFPAHVVGNGKDSIAALNELRIESRQKNPFRAARPLPQAELELALLMARRSWNDVPRQGEVILLTTDLTPSSTGDSTPSLDMIPDSMKTLAISAAKALGAPNCALDMMLDRSGVPFVLELNIRAMITGICFPWPVGEISLDVPVAIFEHFFGKGFPPKAQIASFDFSGLRAAILDPGRRAQGVDAADFAGFAEFKYS